MDFKLAIMDVNDIPLFKKEIQQPSENHYANSFYSRRE